MHIQLGPLHHGPFDAVVFNATLAAQADPANALRRATLLTRPGARVVVSERAPEPSEEEEGEPSPAVADFDVAALAGDLPMEATGLASGGKVMDVNASAVAAVEDPSGGALWVWEVPPLYALRDAVTLAAPVVTGFGRGGGIGHGLLTVCPWGSVVAPLCVF